MSKITYWYPFRALDHPCSASSNLISLTFVDGGTFTENETFAESQNLTVKATYLVLYNFTNPSTAIEIRNLPWTSVVLSSKNRFQTKLQI
jgi:hypothetical protein